jgi:hypothetical protein
MRQVVSVASALGGLRSSRLQINRPAVPRKQCHSIFLMARPEAVLFPPLRKVTARARARKSPVRQGAGLSHQIEGV